MKWIIKNENPITTLAELETELLGKLNISSGESLIPKDPMLLSPTEVGIDSEQMKVAIELIRTAKDKNKRVVIYGDYDADGICATTVLWTALKHIGLEAEPFIPIRDVHGYGLSTTAIDEWQSAGSLPDLVITVDNGIVAHKPVSKLKELGVEVIVTDHHQGETKLPPADAVIHTTKLAGAGVAWMLAKELAPEQVSTTIDLVGIATIADQVPLLGFNRSMAWHGINLVKQNKRLGVKKLLEMAKIKQDSISEETVNFGIAPRLNAMGRLAHGLDAFKLLTATTKEEAARYAQILDDTNQDRKLLTKQYYDQAEKLVVDQKDQNLIMVLDSGFHEGVIGLIAGRLAEKYFKPTIVMSIDEEGNIKGSARSIAGVNIVELIRSKRSYLNEVGGHPMAAGFSLEKSKFEEFRLELQKTANQEIHADLLVPAIEIDFVLDPSMISFDLIKLVDKFRPFGQKYPSPKFLFKDLKVSFVKTIGQKAEHLSIGLASENLSRPIRAVAWRQGEKINELVNKPDVQVVAKPSVNHYQGRDYLQLVVTDLHLVEN